MKKFISLILGVLLLSSILMVDTALAAGTSFKVWIVPNTVKILKDQEVPLSTQTAVKVRMAKNECESGQVIITAGTAAIGSVTATISNLVSGTNIIPSSDVKIYVQHYINVTQPTTGHFTAGWYPDAMIPYQSYIQKHGSIAVQAGKNQGMWFTFKTGKQTPAGTYTGNITLTVDGTSQVAPVELKVSDFSLTDEIHSLSAFANWDKDMLLAGHPGIQLNSPEYWALLENYYYFLLDYRLNATYLPISDDDVNLYVQNAAKYVNDPRVGAFNIAYRKGDFDNGRAAQIVQALRNAGLLSKAYYYLGGEIDEPSPDRYPAVIDFCNKIKAIDPNLRHIVTTDIVKELIGNVNTFCPLYTNFSIDYYRQLARQRLSAGDGVWWYGCVGPQHPYPSYHTDDYQLSPRVVSWMQKSIGIQGNLYWATDIYKKYDGSQYIPRDIWNDPKAFPGANGDGFLLYPGTDYGINGPIGTVRLEAIRDGNEDYEYLWTLEQKINAAASSLGVNVKLDDIMKPLYNRVFNNINDYTKNPEVLDSVRNEVADMIECLDRNPKALVVMGADDAAKSQKEVVVYAELGTAVKINGINVNASGVVGNASKYVANVVCTPGLNKVDIEYSKNGSTCTLSRKFLWSFNSSIVVNSFENQTDMNRVTAQNGVTVSLSNQYVTRGTGSMKAVIPAVNEFPGFLVSVDPGAKNVSQCTTLEMDVYNSGSVSQEFYGKFYNDKGNVYDTKIGQLAPGKTTHVSYDIVNLPGSFDKTCVKEILFWLPGKNSASIDMYIDNIHIEKSDFVLVNPFESTGDIQKFSTENGVTLSRSNEGVTQGSHSMKATISASNQYPQFPGFSVTADSGFSNISDYALLELDVYNNSSQNQEFFTKFFNSKGQAHDVKVADLAPGQVTHVSYQLKNIPAQFDKTCISKILFWMWGGNSQVTSLYVDNLGFRIKNAAEINNFENTADIQRFAVENGVALSMSDQHVTQGTGSMKVVLPVGNEFPGFKTNPDTSVKNIRGCDKLEMDVFNESTKSIPLYGKFFNDKGQVFDVRVADLPAGQSTHVAYSLDGFPWDYDKSCISTILFWTWGKNNTAINLYVDKLYFSRVFEN